MGNTYSVSGIKELLDLIPNLTSIQSITDLVDEIATTYRKEIIVLPLPDTLSSATTGMLLSIGKKEYIFYRDVGNNSYREHLILHEIYHLISNLSNIDKEIHHGTYPYEIKKSCGTQITTEEFSAENFAMVVSQFLHRKAKLNDFDQKIRNIFG